MIDQQSFARLLPKAVEWAKVQEQWILQSGALLGEASLLDARQAGVEDCARIRVLIVDRIPLPADPELAAAARQSHIMTDASRGVAIGHGIIIRADSWGDRELMLHQFVHVAQCESSGGLEPYMKRYLCERQTCATFTVGSLEDEARRVSREICADARSRPAQR